MKTWIGLLVAASMSGCGGAEMKTEAPGIQIHAPAESPTAKAPFRTIRIRVLGPDRKPVEGADIHPAVWTDEDFKEKDVVTDRDGYAVVGLPRTFEIFRVWATKHGHVPMFAHWEEEELAGGTHVVPKDFEFHLIKGTTIGGFVHNQDGKPIAGARVEVMRDISEAEDGARMSYDIWLAYGSGAPTTDDQGSWTVGNVPPGDDISVQVKLTHPDYVRDLRWGGLQEEQGVTMKSLRDRTAKIVMKRGINVIGTVTDPDGKPVPNAVVIWGDDPQNDEGSQEVRTNEKGFYRFPPLPSVEMNITVVAKGWAPALRKVEISRTMQPCDFKLKAGHTVRIRFVDVAGKAVPNVYVSVQGWRGLESLYNRDHSSLMNTDIPRRSDANGLFEWTWAPHDKVTYGFAIEEYEILVERALGPSEEEHEVRLIKE